MSKPRILIAEDEHKMRRILQIILSGIGCTIDLAEDGIKAWNLFQQKTYDLVITDLKMPTMDGMMLLKKVHQQCGDVPVIVITAFGSIDSAVSAMKKGAFDYITKPFENDQIRLIVQKALVFYRLKNENRRLREVVGLQHGFDRFIGESLPIRKVKDLAQQVAHTASTVLIQGESGTGKELIARLIHFNSPRATHPFVAVNCGALPTNLLESELFGYEKGAFTGAQKRKPGRFEMADEGTLFLDEIGDMDQNLQVKMLRALEERTFERLGGTESVQVNVRVIAATNQDLKAMIRESQFRSDLYFRLNIFPILIPPLREHPEDIPLLVDHFLSTLARQIGKPVTHVSKNGMARILKHSWPGNIRELQNCLERAMILCQLDEITCQDLLIESIYPTGCTSPLELNIPPEGISLEAVESNLIEKALTAARGNQSRAAELLGVTRNTLRYRMEKYGITYTG